MADEINKNMNNADVPDTTQKKDGTTSAFSAASAQDSEEQQYREDGTQGRASFHTGSTTQGGSNYGQGSSALGPSAYEQGATSNDGANYENEAGRFATTGTQADGTDPKKQGGTTAEHDETSGVEGEDTAGIP